MQTTPLSDKIIIDKSYWISMKKNPHYAELIEEIEDAMDLEEAKKEAASFKSFLDYDKEKKDVN